MLQKLHLRLSTQLISLEQKVIIEAALGFFKTTKFNQLLVSVTVFHSTYFSGSNVQLTELNEANPFLRSA